MFEPGQFEVNEAWIVFRLNDAPISTGADGDFNVVCLMDAGSCYMLGNEFVPAHLAGLSESSAERLVETGRSQGQNLTAEISPFYGTRARPVLELGGTSRCRGVARAR